MIGVIGLLGTCYLSEVIDSRVLSTVVLQFWALPLLITLYTFTEHASQWVYFTVATLIVGFPYVHPIQVAWASRNSNGVRTRTVSAAMYNIFTQVGSIISVSDYIFVGQSHFIASNQPIRQISIEPTTSPFVSLLGPKSTDNIL